MKFKWVIILGIIILSVFINVGTPVCAIERNVEKTIIKTINFQDNDLLGIEPYASATYQRHTVGTFTDTVRGKKLMANVTLKVTIRVNESTGVITSYSGPYLSQNWIDVGAYEGFLQDISTEATLSASKRTLHCVGNFKIYARSPVGTDPHYSKEFTIELDAQ